MPSVPGRCCRSVLLTLLAAGSPAAAQPALLIVGEDGLDTPHSYATAVSGDGLVMSGIVNQLPAVRAFRWTAGSGLVLLDPATNDPNEQDIPFALSADGSVMVGYRAILGFPIGAVWPTAGPPVEIGSIAPDPDSSFSYSNAAACDATGSVIVGISTTASGIEAVRWTQGDGFTPLGGLATTPPFASEALGIDASGTIIGHSTNDADKQVLFRWTDAGGMLPLPTGPFDELDANDASPDGRSMTGGARSEGETTLTAMVWTEGAGLSALPKPAGANSAAGSAVGNGGQVVYGRFEPAATPPGTAGFVWTSDLGSVNLNQYCIDELGIDPGDWVLYPEDADATGNIVVGVARYHPDDSPFALAEAAFILDISFCEADVTRDGLTNFFDVAQFIALFNANDPAADLDDNGLFNFFDVAAFIALYGDCT